MSKQDAKTNETLDQSNAAQDKQVAEVESFEGVKTLSKKEIKAAQKAQKKAEKEAAAQVKAIDKEKAARKAEKAKKEKKSLKQRTKETVSELKKVTWPTFGNVVKKTGVVLVVVIVFAVVLFAVDMLLGWLFGLITG